MANNNHKPYSILENELFKRNLSRDEIALLIGMKKRKPAGPLYYEYKEKMSKPYENLSLLAIEKIALKIGRTWFAVADLCKLGNLTTAEMNPHELKIWSLRVYMGK